LIGAHYEDFDIECQTARRSLLVALIRKLS